MRPLPALLAIALLAAAAAVGAQSPAGQAPPAPQPAQQPAAQVPVPERTRAGGTALNLQLDDTSRRRIMSGATEEGGRGADKLPSLGGDARTLDPKMRSAPYPSTADTPP